VWRLRLPLPWPGVPHCNAWALAAGDGIVLVDCGMDEPGSMRHLERALEQVGLRLELVRLLVCTHAHIDHCGQAAAIQARTGCDLWIHPRHEHLTALADDPEAALARRVEIARQSGVPEAPLREWAEGRRGESTGMSGPLAPARDLLPGVVVETDLGPWDVIETPGHAPSHVVLHQPERRLLLSGDHLLGKVSLYYDYGNSPDPAGEFLRSLDVVDELEVDLILAGHGRPVRGARELAEANRSTALDRIDRVRRALAEGPKTGFEIVPALLDGEPPNPLRTVWAMGETMVYLQHLRVREEAEPESENGVDRWRLSP
jgi:glyoxylase-like metal-dependent hydrolase (beta-lactamase superfamily II)